MYYFRRAYPGQAFPEDHCPPEDVAVALSRPGLHPLTPTQGTAPHDLSQLSGVCLWQDLFLTQELPFGSPTPTLFSKFAACPSNHPAPGILVQGQAGVTEGMIAPLLGEPSSLKRWHWVLVGSFLEREGEWRGLRGAPSGVFKDCKDSGSGHVRPQSDMRNLSDMKAAELSVMEGMTVWLSRDQVGKMTDK